MPLSPGETFAGYRIVRLLGSGGMGEVYLAEHPRLPRRDALKVLPAEFSADSDYRERFVREADLAANLWHPHIVSVHDRGEDNGQLWISMNYVDGLDAARLLAARSSGGLPLDQVVRIVEDVAAGLDYAHKQGLLHRDVKPANIMLSHADDEGQQRVLLTDFGIARNVGEISGLTATNMTVGTVAYAAPEQLLGEDLDGRADQYALAATAYHLLTGSQLFPHSNPAVVIGRHLNATPPTLASSYPELSALDPVLALALAKSPQDRFSKCTDFARVLASARDQVGDSEQVREPPFSRGARFAASLEGSVVDHDISPPKPPPSGRARPSAASGEDPTMPADAASPPSRHWDSSRADPPASTPKTRPLMRPATLLFVALAVALVGAFIVVGAQIAHNHQLSTSPTAAPNTVSTSAAAGPAPQTKTAPTMSTGTTITASTTAPAVPVIIDVDPADYESDDAPGYFTFAFSKKPEYRDCSIARGGVACSVEFPPGTPEVTNAPFSGTPNTVQLDPPDGPKDVIGEGGPPTARTLLPNHRITVGDITCTALIGSGVDCEAPTSGFRFEDGVLTKHGKS